MGLWRAGIFVAAVAAAIFAQSELGADPYKVLTKVAETYRNLNRFEWTALSTWSTDSGAFQPHTEPAVGAFRRPHSMRVDWNGSGPPSHWIAIANGAEAWLFYSSLNAFCRPDSKLLQRTPQEAMGGVETSLPYERILDGLQSARLVGERILGVAGLD
ncbi:MAG: hypothetical protein LAQ30_11160 [Acidobacteriia bacterium]|nr:hypothetical protein [Terriglobia bacterium]